MADEKSKRRASKRSAKSEKHEDETGDTKAKDSSKRKKKKEVAKEDGNSPQDSALDAPTLSADEKTSSQRKKSTASARSAKEEPPDAEKPEKGAKKNRKGSTKSVTIESNVPLENDVGGPTKQTKRKQSSKSAKSDLEEPRGSVASEISTKEEETKGDYGVVLSSKSLKSNASEKAESHKKEKPNIPSVATRTATSVVSSSSSGNTIMSDVSKASKSSRNKTFTKKKKGQSAIDNFFAPSENLSSVNNGDIDDFNAQTLTSDVPDGSIRSNVSRSLKDTRPEGTLRARDELKQGPRPSTSTGLRTTTGANSNDKNERSNLHDGRLSLHSTAAQKSQFSPGSKWSRNDGPTGDRKSLAPSRDPSARKTPADNINEFEPGYVGSAGRTFPSRVGSGGNSPAYSRAALENAVNREFGGAKGSSKQNGRDACTRLRCSYLRKGVSMSSTRLFGNNCRPTCGRTCPPNTSHSFCGLSRCPPCPKQPDLCQPDCFPLSRTEYQIEALNQAISAAQDTLRCVRGCPCPESNAQTDPCSVPVCYKLPGCSGSRNPCCSVPVCCRMPGCSGSCLCDQSKVDLTNHLLTRYQTIKPNWWCRETPQPAPSSRPQNALTRFRDKFLQHSRTLYKADDGGWLVVNKHNLDKIRENPGLKISRTELPYETFTFRTKNGTNTFQQTFRTEGNPVYNDRMQYINFDNDRGYRNVTDATYEDRAKPASTYSRRTIAYSGAGSVRSKASRKSKQSKKSRSKMGRSPDESNSRCEESYFPCEICCDACADQCCRVKVRQCPCCSPSRNKECSDECLEDPPIILNPKQVILNPSLAECLRPACKDAGAQCTVDVSEGTQAFCGRQARCSELCSTSCHKCVTPSCKHAAPCAPQVDNLCFPCVPASQICPTQTALATPGVCPPAYCAPQPMCYVQPGTAAYPPCVAVGPCMVPPGQAVVCEPAMQCSVPCSPATVAPWPRYCTGI